MAGQGTGWTGMRALLDGAAPQAVLPSDHLELGDAYASSTDVTGARSQGHTLPMTPPARAEAGPSLGVAVVSALQLWFSCHPQAAPENVPSVGSSFWEAASPGWLPGFL